MESIYLFVKVTKAFEYEPFAAQEFFKSFFKSAVRHLLTKTITTLTKDCYISTDPQKNMTTLYELSTNKVICYSYLFVCCRYMNIPYPN